MLCLRIETKNFEGAIREMVEEIPDVLLNREERKGLHGEIYYPTPEVVAQANVESACARNAGRGSEHARRVNCSKRRSPRFIRSDCPSEGMLSAEGLLRRVA